MGFKNYTPPYLSREASDKNLIYGANFASAEAGYDEKANTFFGAITLSQQLKLYKEYQLKLDCPRSMVNFKDGGRRSGSNRLIFCPFDEKDNGEEEMDEFLHQPEKKRRLTAHQVQFLEKSFEQENKLEPDRKTQLAKEIGLQPRQVAIWFQNRRARWKTKQLEKDFEVLQSDYDTLKAEYENLVHEKDKLEEEVLLLSEKLLLKEKDKGILEFEEPPLNERKRSLSKDDEEDSNAVNLSCKLEDVSSVKSDIFNSDKSDISNEEEDSLEKTIFPPYIFPKLEDEDYSDPPTSSCNFGFHVEDNAFWSWSY